MPDGGQCKGLPVIGKTQPFKPCHQIIGKEREFGIEGVGIECGGRSLAERIIFLECSDDSFHGGAFLIVSEYVVWFHGKVGDDDRISMPVKGKSVVWESAVSLDSFRLKATNRSWLSHPCGW